MKKILVLLFMILFINTCFAANWEQVAEKTWIDLSSWRKDGYNISAWFKELNPGNWDNIKNKKVWFRMVRYTADCQNNQIGVVKYVIYDLKGNIIESSNFSYIEMEEVIPESTGEFKYTVLCNLN